MTDITETKIEIHNALSLSDMNLPHTHTTDTQLSFISIDKKKNMSSIFGLQNVLATSAFSRKKSSVKAKIVGSTVAGVSEICIFHPIDTVAKRLMNNKVQITNAQMFRSVALNNSGISKLYAGISAGFMYKVSQRTYKYGGQSYLNDLLQKDFNASKLVSQSLSGCMIGMGEVFLLPLDILKIRTQLFPEKYAGRSLFSILRAEGSSMYNGTAVTMLRNGLGSTALFGANQLTRNFLLKGEERQATLSEIVITSTVASVSSLVVSSPFDVMKVRVQADPEGGTRARHVFGEIMKHEGAGAFWKGMGPKIMVVGPKLIFSFTIAQYVISRFDDYFSNQKKKEQAFETKHLAMSSSSTQKCE